MRKIFQAAVAVSLCLNTTIAADVLTGRIIKVTDGDDVVLHADGAKADEQLDIRLDGIDAPELAQPFGKQAHEALAKSALGKSVKVTIRGKDQYGRTLGIVWVGGRSLSVETVRAGLAWHYKHFVKSESLAKAELEAREKKRGLWSDPSPEPPWEFRRRMKAQGKTKDASRSTEEDPFAEKKTGGEGKTEAASGRLFGVGSRGKLYCRLAQQCVGGDSCRRFR